MTQPGIAEHSDTLTCPQGHSTEVFWDPDSKAEYWYCPTCRETRYRERVAEGVSPAAAADEATELSRVAFEVTK